MAEFISLLPCVEHPSWQLPHVILNIIWVEAVRYNEMFVLPGSRVSTMRCSGVPATGHLNIRHGTPEHLIVRTVTHKPTNQQKRRIYR